MKLSELEEFTQFNELDMLYKLIEKTEGIKKRTEELIKGNKTAGVDVRKTMQDIRLISEIIRDEVQRRKFTDTPKENSKLFQAIQEEKTRLAREENRIKQLEEKRIVQR